MFLFVCFLILTNAQFFFFVLQIKYNIYIYWRWSISLRLIMNEWCIYIALYCVLLYTQSALQSWGGGSLLNHHQCAASTWMMWRLPHDNGTSALTTHQLQVERREIHRDNQVYALTTHQLQVERRESHRDNQVYALTTHQLQVERRESHRDNQVYALTTPPATGGEERES